MGRLCVAGLIVLLQAGCWASEEAVGPPIRLDPVSEIGCLECDGPELFGHVADAGLLGDSVLFVLTRSQPHLRTFTLAGESLDAFVQTGDGPNEIRFPFFAIPRSGPSISVFAGRQGFRQFNLQGKTISDAAEAGRIGWSGLVGSPDGRFYVAIGSEYWPADGIVIRLFDHELRAVRDAAVPKALMDGDSSDRVTQFSFAVAVSNEGAIAVGSVRGYEIHLLDPAGGPPRVVQREAQARIRTPEDLARIGAPPPGPQPSGVSIPKSEPSPTDPYFTALHFDMAGRLWARGEREGVAGAVIDVFERDLTFLGELRTGEDLETFRVQGHRVVGVVLDSLDVPRVKVWAVQEVGP